MKKSEFQFVNSYVPAFLYSYHKSFGIRTLNLENQFFSMLCMVKYCSFGIYAFCPGGKPEKLGVIMEKFGGIRDKFGGIVEKLGGVRDKLCGGLQRKFASLRILKNTKRIQIFSSKLTGQADYLQGRRIWVKCCWFCGITEIYPLTARGKCQTL